MDAKSAPWDEIPWTPECQERAIAEVVHRVPDKQSLVWIMWTTVAKAGEFMAVFRKLNWTIVAEWVWHKIGHNYPIMATDCIRAFEFFFVASFSTNKVGHFSGMTDPSQRQNVLVIPSVTTLSDNGDGAPINVCEKPVQVAEHLIAVYTNAEQNVLVIGSGSGSECIAALNLGRKCWAVETDKVQWYASSARIKVFCENTLLGKECGGDLAFLNVAGKMGMKAEKKRFTKRIVASPDASPTEGGSVPDSASVVFESSQASAGSLNIPLTQVTCLACGIHKPDVDLVKCDHCTVQIHGSTTVVDGDEPLRGCGQKCQLCDLPSVCPNCYSRPQKNHPPQLISQD